MIPWPLVGLSAGGGALLAGGLAFLLHSWDVNNIEDRHRKALDAQNTTLIAECEADKLITTEVSYDYQQKNRALNAQLAKLKRVHSQPACAPLQSAGPAGGANGTPEGTLNAGPSGGRGGLNVEWLYDYGAECEQYRLQLIGLQDFVNRTWEAKQ